MLVAPSLEVSAKVSFVKLTPRQSQLLALIVLFIRKNCIPPTICEMKEAMGYTSNAPVQNLVNTLARYEIISWTSGQVRCIRVLVPVTLEYKPVLYRIKFYNGFFVGGDGKATKECDRALQFPTRKHAELTCKKLRAAGVKSRMFIESVDCSIPESEPIAV